MINNYVELAFSIFFFIGVYSIYYALVLSGKYDIYSPQTLFSFFILVFFGILFFLTSYFGNIFFENIYNNE